MQQDATKNADALAARQDAVEQLDMALMRARTSIERHRWMNELFGKYYTIRVEKRCTDSEVDSEVRKLRAILDKHYARDRKKPTVSVSKRYGGDSPDEPTVTLPLSVAEVVLACAKDGMRKGQGRGRLRNTRRVLVQQASVATLARRRRDELKRELASSDLAQGKEPTDLNDRATKQALREASVFAFERFGLYLRESTIKRMMQSSDDTLWPGGGASDVD